MTRRVANMKGLGNAFDNDASRSSMWLRTKDFLHCDLRGRNWFGWFRDHGFAGVGAGYMGGCATGARLLLVLYGSRPHAGFLGRLSAVEFLKSKWRKCHDVLRADIERNPIKHRRSS